MRTLHLVEQADADQRSVWRSFPSWTHFSWLYLLSALSSLRGALSFKFGMDGWEAWLMGSGILLACVAVLRHWAQYELTRDRITVQNYYTKREIQSIPLSEVEDVVVRQGVIARFFGIGTVVVRARTSDRLLWLPGVSDPEELKIRVKALSWKHSMVTIRPVPRSS